MLHVGQGRWSQSHCNYNSHLIFNELRPAEEEQEEQGVEEEEGARSSAWLTINVITEVPR